MVTQSESFRKLIKELDPTFILPDTKLIKLIIHKAYNHTLPYIKNFLNKNATSVSLITDMWTAKNRQGFLGVTCSFLDRNFVMHKMILTVEYVRYSHSTHCRKYI